MYTLTCKSDLTIALEHTIKPSKPELETHSSCDNYKHRLIKPCFVGSSGPISGITTGGMTI